MKSPKLKEIRNEAAIDEFKKQYIDLEESEKDFIKNYPKLYLKQNQEQEQENE